MKKLVFGILALIFVLGVAASADSAAPNYNIEVKNIYAAPDDNSALVYSIPIEVKLLDISADNNWYKVKISYRLGPLSNTIVGWTQIPVGDVITARQKAMDDVAKAVPPEETEQAEQ